MRIIEITNNWPAEVFINRHLCALIDNGLMPTLVVRHIDGKYIQSASISNLDDSAQEIPNFDHLPFIKKITSGRYLLSHRKLMMRKEISYRNKVLLAFFDNLQPDLIHFHNASLALNMSWLARELGVPYTISFRGTDVQVNPLVSEENKNHLLETVADASGIHTVCDAIWNTTVKLLGIELRKVNHQTIYTTVPIPEKALGYPVGDQTQYIFVTVGRLHWRKAFPNLLIGFKNLLEKGLRAHLQIVGSGSEQESIMYWIHSLGLKSQVSILGKLSYDEFSKLMGQANGYIQSSIAEGFSNATAEAMAMGLPVFATHVGGTSEVIQEGQNGFLLDPHHPAEWWKKLELVQDRQKMCEVGMAAYQTAKQTFSSQKHAKQFIEFYTRILNGS